MDQHVFVAMFGPMPAHPTGLAMSVLRRAQALAKASISTDILIDTFYPDYDSNTNGLRQSGRLGDAIRLRSLHHDLAGEDVYPAEAVYRAPLDASLDYVVDPKEPRVRRGYTAQKVYQHFVWFRGERVHFIDHLQHGKRVRREWHDDGGAVCKVEIMNADNRAELVRYLRRDGTCYMEDIMDAPSGRVRGIVVTGTSGVSYFFQDTVELFAYWMQEYVLRDAQTAPTIISEYGVRRLALEKLQRENSARVIYTVHNNHLAVPGQYGSGTRDDMRDFIEHIPTVDDVIVLTEEQRQDLWKQLGYLPSIHVIPHHMVPSDGGGQRDPRKVVMLGRFEPVKGQVPALSAFKQVLDAVPDAHLDLYGRGSDEKRIREAISELGLGESVALRGFSDDASQVFSGAAVSIVASEYEGFCLSMAESMAAGCVPVCYEFKYGPRDLVRHGVDGLLVQQGNIKDLADSIIFLLLNDEQREQMSDTARTIARRFSEQRLIDDWKTVLGDERIGKHARVAADPPVRIA
ncbi:glycosyltransferase [Arthrobacter sp. CP30]